jgi:glycosyltransferase involved in cell wall biosynthesis
MNVAFICAGYGNVFRGSEIFVHELSIRLRKKGHEVKIYPHVSKIETNTQIVVSTNGRIDAVKAKIWCLLNNAKLIIPGQSGPGFDDRLNLYLFPNCFVGLTEFQCQWARNKNRFVKIVKIPNGVDLVKFTSIAKPVKIDLPRPIILCVGEVSPSKSGEVSKRQELLKKAAAKIKTSVLLVGRGGDMVVAHELMPGVYKAADIFSYPTSPSESFGIAMVEAMAMGLPVVATDDPIRREIVGNAGLFIDPDNSDEYAAALQKALNTDWGDKPRRQAERFSWDQIALEYDRLFKTL